MQTMSNYAWIEVLDTEQSRPVAPQPKAKPRSITQLAKMSMAKRKTMQRHLGAWGEYKSGGGSDSVFAKYQELGGFDAVDHDGYDGGISDFQSLVFQIDAYVDNLPRRDKDLIMAEYQTLEAERVRYWSIEYGVSQTKYEKEHRRITLKMAMEINLK